MIHDCVCGVVQGVAYIRQMTRPVLPRLAADPDGRLIRWGWVAWLVLTVLLGALLLRTRTWDAAIQVIPVVQAAALWILWPLWRGGRATWHWLRASPYTRWNGSYYEFDGRQMRVLLDDDDVFIVAADVFAALDLHGRATDPARVRAIAGRDGLVTVPALHALVFTERGLEAWLDRRSDEKAVALHRWYAQQVIKPHRNRRAHR